MKYKKFLLNQIFQQIWFFDLKSVVHDWKSNFETKLFFESKIVGHNWKLDFETKIIFESKIEISSKSTTWHKNQNLQFTNF